MSTATDIIIKALTIKLSHVHDILEKLSMLVGENPRQTTPTELSFSRYEEWLESNQQLFEFNSQLYELERVKFDLKQKQERVKRAPKTKPTTLGGEKREDMTSMNVALCTLYMYIP